MKGIGLRFRPGSAPLLAAALLAASLSGCAELDSLRSRVAAQERQIGEMRSDLDQWESRYYETKARWDEDVKSHGARIELMNRSLERAQSRLSDRERKLAEDLHRQELEAGAAKSDLEARMKSKSREADRLGGLLSNAEDKQLKLQARVVELEAENDQDKRALQRLEAQLQGEQSKVASLADARDSLQSQVQSHRNMSEEISRKYKEVSSQLEADEQLLDQANVTIEALESAHGDAKGDAKAGATKLVAAAKESVQLEAKIEELEGAIEALKTKSTDDAKAASRADPVLSAAAEKITALLGRFDHGDKISVLIDERGLRIIILSDVAFNRASVLLSDNIKPMLAALGSEIAAAPERTIRIEGHTDNAPIFDLPFADNWGLGASRAHHIGKYLVEQSRLEPSRIIMVSRSFYDPMASNKDPIGRAQNRRVEIIITPDAP